MVVAAERIRSLNKYEKTILLALERGMKRYSWVPLELLKTATKLSESEINYRLSRLIAWGMVRFNPVPYDGYSLVFGGYDTLALATLTRKGTISALGTQIGEGKESVVYDALGLGPVAIKFHRVGGRSFSSARLNREYMPEDGHCPWLIASKKVRGTGISRPHHTAPESQRAAAHRPEPAYRCHVAGQRAEPEPVPARSTG